MNQATIIKDTNNDYIAIIDANESDMPATPFTCWLVEQQEMNALYNKRAEAAELDRDRWQRAAELAQANRKTAEDETEELFVKLEQAQKVVDHAMNWCLDTGGCLFCGYPYRYDGKRGHEDFCPLLDVKQ
jgi:hypothetical protein